MRQLLIAALFVTALSSISVGQQSAALRKTIEANNQRFVEAFNRGDAAAIAAMYASGDPRLMPPNSPVIGNRQGIQSFWQGLISAGIKAAKLETTEVVACGNTAYEVGKYELTIPKAGGGTVTDYGKYVVVWKKEGRQWKLARDIWNTNMAATGQ